MFNLKRKLVAAAMMTCIASAGAFAQRDKDREDKRPKKNPDVVVIKPKGEKPPPPRDNQGDKNKGKRGKP